jgi:hypothetical protein
MSDLIFYVYQYLLEDGTPYYIGKGSKDRINESHAPWVELPIKELRQFIKTGLTEKEAFDLEIDLIKKYGRRKDGGILENKKISRWVAQSGWKHSQAAKEKISLGNLGKLRTEEQKLKLRTPKTKEHAEKIRLANLGRKDDGRYKKISDTMKLKKWYSDGTTTKMFVPGTEETGFYPGRILRSTN